MEPVDNGKWVEPDSAAGIAYFEYMAYKKFGKPQHLEGATLGLDYLGTYDLATGNILTYWLDSIDFNPLYEILLTFGPLAAARMNAEQGTNYSIRTYRLALSALILFICY